MDLQRNLSSSTPKSSCNYKRKMPPSKRRAFESPMSSYTDVVPITPMPNFNEMDTPEIQRRAEKIGLKKQMAKTKLRTKLKEVYLYKHQVYSPLETADNEMKNSYKNEKSASINSSARNETLFSISTSEKSSESNDGKMSANDSDIILVEEGNDKLKSRNNHDSLTSGHVTPQKCSEKDESDSNYCSDMPRFSRKNIMNDQTFQEQNSSSKKSMQSINENEICEVFEHNIPANTAEPSSNYAKKFSVDLENDASYDLATNESFVYDDIPDIGGDPIDLNLSGVVRMDNVSTSLQSKFVKEVTDSPDGLDSTDTKLLHKDEPSPLKCTPIKSSVPSKPCVIISLLDSSGESEHLGTGNRISPISATTCAESVNNLHERKSFPFAVRRNDTKNAAILADDSNVVSLLDNNEDETNVLCTHNDKVFKSSPTKSFSPTANILNKSPISTLETPTEYEPEENFRKLSTNTMEKNSMTTDRTYPSEFVLNNQMKNTILRPSSPTLDLEFKAKSSQSQKENIAIDLGDKERQNSNTADCEVISLLSDDSIHEEDAVDEANVKDNLEFEASLHEDSEPRTSNSENEELCSSQEDAGSDHEELHRSLFQSFHQESSSESEEEEECLSLMQRILKKNQVSSSGETEKFEDGIFDGRETVLSPNKNKEFCDINNYETSRDGDSKDFIPTPFNGPKGSAFQSENLEYHQGSLKDNISAINRFIDVCENNNSKTKTGTSAGQKRKKVGSVNSKTVKILPDKSAQDVKEHKTLKKIKLSEPERTLAILKAIRSNEDIYMSVLQYKPVYLSQFKRLMEENYVRVRAADLLDFLDSRGITFSTADENKIKAVRVPKKKKKS